MYSDDLATKGRELTEDMIFVLSSRTRVEILRYLKCHQMTVTDLSRVMNFCKSTLHAHLQRLLDAGLVHRDNGRKWIYYRLSRKGNYVVGMMG